MSKYTIPKSHYILLLDLLSEATDHFYRENNDPAGALCFAAYQLAGNWCTSAEDDHQPTVDDYSTRLAVEFIEKFKMETKG